MMGFDPRAAKAAWSIFLVALVLLAIYQTRTTLFVFIVAIFLAYMLYPLVNFFQTRFPRRLSRNMAITIVYILFITALVFAGITLGSRAVDEAVSFGQRVPDMIQHPDNLINNRLPSWLTPYQGRILAAVRTEFETIGSHGGEVVKEVSVHILAIASNLVYVVLIPILSLLFLIEGPDIRDSFLFWIGRGQRQAMWAGIMEDLDFVLSKYMRSLLVLALAAFIAFLIFFSSTGVPYGLLLSAFASLMEFIPFIGPLAGAGVTLVVAGLNGYTHLLWLVIFFGLFRLFQDYVLNPRLMSQGVELSPLLVIFGVLAGDEIAGVPGMFISIPVLATLRVIAVRVRRASQVAAQQKLEPTPAAPEVLIQP